MNQQNQDDMKLPAQWTIYEKYYNENKKAYQKSLQKIVSFDTVQEFAFLMKSTIYARPTDIFVTPHESNPTLKILHRFNQNQPSNEEVQIDALFFFKYDIQPEWEDIRNKNGGEIQFEITEDYIDKINAFVQDLLIEIVGQCNPVYQQVNGLRLMDKLRGGFKPHVRCDLWLSFDPKDKTNQQSQNDLIQLMNKLLKTHFSKEFQIKEVSHKNSE